MQFDQPAIQISIAMAAAWGNWPNILGELARHPGGTGSPVLGEPVARHTLTDSSSMASKNPKSKAWLRHKNRDGNGTGSGNGTRKRKKEMDKDKEKEKRKKGKKEKNENENGKN